MQQPIARLVREEIHALMLEGADRAAIRRAVRMQVMTALDTMDLTAVRVEQVAYAAMQGAVEAAERTGRPIDIVGQEASAGTLDAVKEKGGQVAHYMKAALQGGTAALEEYTAKLKGMASEAAEKSRQALHTLIERLKSL
ncbi:MAG TPA: hypothetical protein VNP04_13395 [Alphaproteobacteria bacterium]|nr:hypothetical protein [Alphaproteobacteria bacterium]